MELISLKKYIKKRQKDKNTNTKWVGAEIKKRRKEQELTLKEATNGKVSISYLSKLENGKINVNETYVSEILKSMDIKKDFREYQSLYKSYLQELPKLYLEKNSNGINKIYKYIVSIEDYNFSLIKLIYNCYTTNFTNTELIIKELLETKETMTDDELKIFLIFLQKYYILVNNTYNALELVRLIQVLDIKDNYLKIIFQMNLLDITYIMKKESYYTKFNDELIDLLVKYNLFDEAKIANKRYFIEMAKIGNSVYADEYYMNSNSDKRDIYYIKYLLYTKKFELGLKLFEENSYLKEKSNYFVLYLMFLECLKMKEQINTELKNYEYDYNSCKNIEDKIFLNYLFKRTLNQEIDYLVTKAITEAKNYLDPYLITRITLVLTEDYFSKSKYKSFCLAVKENRKIVNNINQLYNKLIVI